MAGGREGLQFCAPLSDRSPPSVGFDRSIRKLRDRGSPSTRTRESSIWPADKNAARFFVDKAVHNVCRIVRASPSSPHRVQLTMPAMQLAISNCLGNAHANGADRAFVQLENSSDERPRIVCEAATAQEKFTTHLLHGM